jgi:putative transposase
VPENTVCPHCGAPHIYIYFNNGNKKSQFKCKVCNHTFKDDIIHRNPQIFCPYCNRPLYKWKERTDFTVYKCTDNECPRYIENYNDLNEKEKVLFKTQPYNFTLHYHYHDYHFDIKQLKHSEPDKPNVDLTKIHNSQNILGLILTFFVSFSISARKTALLLRCVFNINISYQTVLNYTQSASYYCHYFNMKYKGEVDSTMAGDETYIKVSGKNKYIWFFMSEKRRNITSYHYSDSRDTQHAIISMNEASRTAKPNQSITYITDANPSYIAALHYINEAKGTDNPYEHHKVIGLQNLDEESEKYRAFKQLIERLNGTYKSHIKQAHGFSSSNGAIALTTLFVTYYNFLRPHQSLKYNVPVQLDFLNGISTLQAKWLKILSMVYG